MLIYNSTTGQVEEYTGSTWRSVGQAILTTHAAAIDAHVAMMLANLIQGGHPHVLSVLTGWAEVITGSGATAQGYLQELTTGITALSTAARYFTPVGLGVGLSQSYIDWDYPIYMFIPMYARQNSDAQAVSRIQLKEGTFTIGQLGEQGFGIQIANYVLTGESYKAARGTVDLATTLTDTLTYAFLIVLTPGVSVAFYVDSGGGFVLKGTYSVAANVPSGNGVANPRLMHSIINGATGGVNALSYMNTPIIWQRRTV